MLEEWQPSRMVEMRMAQEDRIDRPRIEHLRGIIYPARVELEAAVEKVPVLSGAQLDATPADFPCASVED